MYILGSPIKHVESCPCSCFLTCTYHLVQRRATSNHPVIRTETNKAGGAVDLRVHIFDILMKLYPSQYLYGYSGKPTRVRASMPWHIWILMLRDILKSNLQMLMLNHLSRRVQQLRRWQHAGSGTYKTNNSYPRSRWLQPHNLQDPDCKPIVPCRATHEKVAANITDYLPINDKQYGPIESWKGLEMYIYGLPIKRLWLHVCGKIWSWKLTHD